MIQTPAPKDVNTVTDRLRKPDERRGSKLADAPQNMQVDWPGKAGHTRPGEAVAQHTGSPGQDQSSLLEEEIKSADLHGSHDQPYWLAYNDRVDACRRPSGAAGRQSVEAIYKVILGITVLCALYLTAHFTGLFTDDFQRRPYYPSGKPVQISTFHNAMVSAENSVLMQVNRWLHALPVGGDADHSGLVVCDADLLAASTLGRENIAEIKVLESRLRSQQGHLYTIDIAGIVVDHARNQTPFRTTMTVMQSAQSTTVLRIE